MDVSTAPSRGPPAPRGLRPGASGVPTEGAHPAIRVGCAPVRALGVPVAPAEAVVTAVTVQ